MATHRLGRHIGFVAAWAGGVVAAAASAAHVASGVRQVQRLRTPWRLPPLHISRFHDKSAYILRVHHLFARKTKLQLLLHLT